MAVKLPLCNYAGAIQELQAGDTLPSAPTYGIAELVFGSAPGSQVGAVTLTGLANVTTDSFVSAFMQGSDSTATHNADEHALVDFKITAGSFVAAVGFTLTALSSLRLTGTFKIRYALG